MKQISKEEMKQIYGGELAPINSICGVSCPGGYRSVDCGVGVNCVGDSSSQSVWCDSTEYCPCDAPPPNT